VPISDVCQWPRMGRFVLLLAGFALSSGSTVPGSKNVFCTGVSIEGLPCRKEYYLENSGINVGLSMPNNICKIDGCENITQSRGWCGKHYMRWYTHGEPNKTMLPRDRECSIKGCHKKHVAKGLCGNHYMMKSKYGRTHTVVCQHGHTAGGRISREYVVYHGMISRCYSETNKAYKNYGGRGISVCEAWLQSFESFYSDMGECPEELALERTDNNGNYEPSNCCWASRTQQARNRRNVRMNPVAVRVIRWLLGNTDITQQRLADAYGVTRPVIGNIHRNNTWKEF